MTGGHPFGGGHSPVPPELKQAKGPLQSVVPGGGVEEENFRLWNTWFK